VIIRVKENNQLAADVTDQIRRIEGIERSETLIEFRVYSRYDLELSFSFGVGGEKKNAWPAYECTRILDTGVFCAD
jgi:hypothetical protein